MTIVFFDLETGGLDPHKHAIIQIAAIATRNFKPLDEFECKIQFPMSAADHDALSVNSYDHATWEKEAIHPDEAASKFAAFLSQHATHQCVSLKGKEYVVADLAAHNGAGFDGPFIKAWYKRRGAFFPGYPLVYDTCQLAMWHFRGRDDAPENFKLETLAFHFGIWEPGKYHDAMEDVKATVEIARRLAHDSQQPVQSVQ